MMADKLLNAQDLITAKKHDTFRSEVITGKAGGLSTGANIDYATNAVTGQVQKTLPKIIDDLDWSYVGLFADGVTFTDKTDFAVDAVGTQWIYTGSLPFSAAAGTVPSEPNYQAVHVRSHAFLTDLNPADGSAHNADDIGRGVSTVDADLTNVENSRRDSILLFGGDPSASAAVNLAALQDSKNALGSVFFPAFGSDSDVTYTLSGLSASDLSGLLIHADERAVISLDTDDYDILTGCVFISDVRFYFSNKNFYYVAKKNPRVGKKLGAWDTVPVVDRIIDGVSKLVSISECVGYSWDNQTPLTNLAEISITDNGHYRTIAALNGKTAGIFTHIAIGETVSAHIENNVYSSNGIGILVKSTTGYYYLLKDPTVTGSLLNTYFNNAGSTAAGTHEYPYRGSLSSYEIQNSVISVTRISVDKFRVSINGEDLVAEFSGQGAITHVGFGAQSGGADVNIDVYGMSRQIGKGHTGVGSLSNLLIYGDSTADDFFGAFAQYLQIAGNGAYGAYVNNIVNRGVSGTTLAQMLSLMVSDGLSSWSGRWVVVCGGTNDIQGQVPISSVVSTLNSMIDTIEAAGKRLIFVEPWMFYPSSIVGGRGQSTANYEFGGRYRSVLQYEVARRGHIYARTTELLPSPDYGLIDTFNDPLVRDNIHQSALGYQMYAKMIMEHIIYDATKVEDTWMPIPDHWVAAGVTANEVSWRKTDNGVEIAGTITAASPINAGTILFKLPFKVTTLNVPVVTSNLSSNGSAWVALSPTGTVTAQGVTVGHTYIIFHLNLNYI